MKPLVILGTAIAGGLLVFFIADEEKRKKFANLALPDPENDSTSSKEVGEDLDRKIRELRKALRHAERERKALRNSQVPNLEE